MNRYLPLLKNGRRNHWSRLRSGWIMLTSGLQHCTLSITDNNVYWIWLLRYSSSCSVLPSLQMKTKRVIYNLLVRIIIYYISLSDNNYHTIVGKCKLCCQTRKQFGRVFLYITYTFTLILMPCHNIHTFTLVVVPSATIQLPPGYTSCPTLLFVCILKLLNN